MHSAQIISLCILFCSIYPSLQQRYSGAKYKLARKSFIEEEAKLLTGGNLTLSEKEKKVDIILKKLKYKEAVNVTNDPATFAPGLHFFKAKDIIDQSAIYKFIQQMPKGSLLHGHNTAMVSSNWVIKNITYRPDILKCDSSNGYVIFTFRKSESHNCQNYVHIAEERKNSKNATEYDIELEKHINLYTPHPEIDYPDINLVWTKFQNMFDTVGDLIAYEEVYKIYHTQILQEMYDDNIMYIEFRTSFSKIYDKDGNEWTKPQVMAFLKEIVNDFKKDHPNFLGAKTIFSVARGVNPSNLNKTLDIFKQLYSADPEFVIGFDFVGQEDRGNPLISFAEQLNNLPNNSKLFFHAGETNLYGASSDQNLIDAFLLNTTRIGHGYALFKHPKLWNAIINGDIGIEICPISNQVLNLVTDLRNHPATFYVSQHMPITIANDDPGFWNAKGLSYDFYYALMSFAPETAGISYLKGLVLNSIRFSVLTDDERREAKTIFDRQWNDFLTKMMQQKF